MEEEIWKDIPDYEGLYQISNFGRVKRILFKNGKSKIKRDKIIKPKIEKNNYIRYCLYKNNKVKYELAHKLVLLTFKPNKNNFKKYYTEDGTKIDFSRLEVNHKDENKQNNFVDNLEWCTRLYNVYYGTGIQRQTNPRKIKVNQYTLDNQFIKTWDSFASIKNELNITHACDCCKGKRESSGGYKWKYANYN